MFVIKSDRSKANIPHTIRFTESLYAELNKVAAEHDTSFNSLILQCCRYALDAMNTQEEQGPDENK